MYHFRLGYTAFPDEINISGGFTVLDPDGRCFILINTNHDEESRRQTLKHDFAHIVLGHFEDVRAKDTQTYLANMDELEREANEYADQMTDEEFSELMTYRIGEATRH